MTAHRPLYVRLLGLRHVRPSGWQRAALGEGSVIVAGLVVLADLASAWLLVALPLAVAAVVKGHDLLAGGLPPVGRTDGHRTDGHRPDRPAASP